MPIKRLRKGKPCAGQGYTSFTRRVKRRNATFYEVIINDNAKEFISLLKNDLKEKNYNYRVHSAKKQNKSTLTRF